MYPGMYHPAVRGIAGIGGPKVLTDPKKLQAALAMINADREKQGKPPIAAKPKLTVADVVNAAKGVATRGLQILNQVQGVVSPTPITPPQPPPPPPATAQGLLSRPMLLAAAALAVYVVMRNRRR